MPGFTNHSQADVLRRALIDLGLGTDPTTSQPWPIYAEGEAGQAPDSCITVYSTVGTDDGREMVQGERAEHEGVQIRVRGAQHNTARRKARSIEIFLDQNLYRRQVTIGSQVYVVHQVSRTSTLEARGKDAPNSKRSIFFINAKVTLRQISG